MLDVDVRFKEKNATVRYLPGQVTLSQIIKRYEQTPFGVALSGSVITVARAEPITLRAWTRRAKLEAAKTEASSKSRADAPKPILVFVETVVDKSARGIAKSEFSFAQLDAKGLAADGSFKKTDRPNSPSERKLVVDRFIARVYESVALKSGDSLLPVKFKIETTDRENKHSEATGKLNVVVRTPRRKLPARDKDSKEIALINGRLDLKLGHLCDQRGCLDHFYNSLSALDSVGAVDPRPNLKQPGAMLYLRAGRTIDVWHLRESLRERGVEVAGMVPRGLSGYRLHIDLMRWKIADDDAKAHQCRACRDAVLKAVGSSPVVTTPQASGGRISFAPKTDEVDLVGILDAITDAGVAPHKVWLVPAGAPVPKLSSPLAIKPNVEPKSGGSQSHPAIELAFGHTCDAGPTLSALIGQPGWASRTEFESNKVSTARALIDDRKHAAISPLLSEIRSAGQVPDEIRLRGFGDVRIVLEFAHICGDIVYSKPPRTKKKKPDKPKAGEQKKQQAKPKKPFVPRALHPVASSNGRKAIQAAIEGVPWVKDAVFFDYHTRFKFQGGPKKVMIAFQPKGEGLVRLNDMIDALRGAGFPPKSMLVSRRFSGIPFTAPLPGELLLTDHDGKEKPLSTLKRSDRPLALAFVSLKCKRHKKYKADPKLYSHLGATISKYRDRVDFVAVAANPDDNFEEVATFLKKTNLPAPWHDEHGKIRAVLNSQETPAPHIYIFDGAGRFRYAGDPHDNWDKPDKEKRDYLAQALDAVLSGKYAENGAAFFNKSLCNCSHPKCKCPKCGCGPSCRCAIRH